MSRLVLLCLLLPLTARAGDFAPGGNGATLARASALPALGETRVLQGSRTETRVTLDFTSEYVQEGVCASECITLDGETARLRVSHRRALGRNWDFAIEVPVLDAGGGFLDGWIEQWHDAFGLPTGGRELAPRDRYLFHYERNGTVLLDETRGYTGLGDTQLTVGRRLGEAWVARAMAQLPTGDEQRLAGGAAGGALWFEHALPTPPRWASYTAIGISYVEPGVVLEPMQNRVVGFAGFGLSGPLTRRSSLSLQLQQNTRLYDGSALTPLARPGMPLTIALRVRMSSHSALEFGFQEDPSVNGSPDFAAFISYRAL
jgi:hypothetical protein